VTKPSGKCLFCGSLGLTKEHIWSDWLKKIIPPTDSRFEFREEIRTVSGKPVLIRVPQKKRAGAVQRRQARVVCRQRNGGWMKRIVDNAIPSATSTILGESVTLDAPAQQYLTSWLALSAIVADSQMKNPDKISREDLQFIRQTGLPPSHWLIGAGSYRHDGRVCESQLDASSFI
jgi:hypothetical protein